MPTQKGRGGKKTRKAKKGGENQREIEVKQAGQEYGKVQKLLGNSNCMIYCFDGKQRIGKICGKMRKRVYLKVDDIVLVSLREFEDNDRKCDILLKYYPEEAKELKAIGELPEDLEIEDKKDDPDFYQTKINFLREDENNVNDDDDDQDDLPPNSSDEEAWERERVRNDRRNQAQKADDDDDEDEDDEDESGSEVEDDPEKKATAKVDPKKAEAPKKPITNVAPKKPVEAAPVPVAVPVKANKADLKVKDLKRRKDMDKKRTGGGGGKGSDSESEKSRDRIDDI